MPELFVEATFGLRALSHESPPPTCPGRGDHCGDPARDHGGGGAQRNVRPRGGHAAPGGRWSLLIGKRPEIQHRGRPGKPRGSGGSCARSRSVAPTQRRYVRDGDLSNDRWGEPVRVPGALRVCSGSTPSVPVGAIRARAASFAGTARGVGCSGRHSIDSTGRRGKFRHGAGSNRPDVSVWVGCSGQHRARDPVDPPSLKFLRLRSEVSL